MITTPILAPHTKFITEYESYTPSKNNYDNATFYEQVSVEGLQILAQKGGLTSGCDVKHLAPYWQQADSILEVGSGYGRVLTHLREMGFSGHITGIERSDVFFQHLEKEHAQHATLHHVDIHNHTALRGTFDLILFLWSGIQDFAPIEQYIVIRHLSQLLNKGGKIILDTIPDHTAPLGAKKGMEQDINVFSFNDTTVYIYNIPTKNLDRYAAASGLTQTEHTTYITDTGRMRRFHVLY